MERSKEYYLRLKEEEFDSLDLQEQLYLNGLGLEVRQKPIEIDEQDEHYKKLRKQRIDTFNAEQEYLFKKRNKMFGNGSANFD